uniref:superoxide dismutase n=1 Tax=Anopheles culicifacies TaxID=139723 RepID=A0A182MPB7_9DIPT
MLWSATVRMFAVGVAFCGLYLVAGQATIVGRLTDDVEFIDPTVGLGPGGTASGIPIGPGGFRGFEILPRPEPSWKAGATLVADNPEQQIMGTISFRQWAPGHVQTAINATGLPVGKHAVHVHAFGDMREGCKSTGPHFRSSIIGNIEVKDDGNAMIDFHSPYINLFGFAGIVGRSIVIHEKPSEIYRFPDLSINNPISFQGEEDTVGSRIACGLITILDNVAP